MESRAARVAARSFVALLSQLLSALLLSSAWSLASVHSLAIIGFGRLRSLTGIFPFPEGCGCRHGHARFLCQGP
jgi:hypothetical protein